MYSKEFMSYLMENPIKKKKEVKKEHYLKKGLAGVINFINATAPNDQKVYN